MALYESPTTSVRAFSAPEEREGNHTEKQRNADPDRERHIGLSRAQNDQDEEYGRKQQCTHQLSAAKAAVLHIDSIQLESEPGIRPGLTW